MPLAELFLHWDRRSQAHFRIPWVPKCFLPCHLPISSCSFGGGGFPCNFTSLTDLRRVARVFFFQFAQLSICDWNGGLLFKLLTCQTTKQKSSPQFFLRLRTMWKTPHIKKKNSLKILITLWLSVAYLKSLREKNCSVLEQGKLTIPTSFIASFNKTWALPQRSCLHLYINCRKRRVRALASSSSLLA